MTQTDQIKLLHFNLQLFRDEIAGVEARYGVEVLERTTQITGPESAFYLQFDSAIRLEAERMASHYQLFYCLENSIRELVQAKLAEAHGQDWWSVAVPESVRLNVKRNFEREREAGITLRSPDLIDYTTFGELGEIIQANWDAFGDVFNNRKAVARILTGLNVLRAPIAHCAPLAEDEVTRLNLALSDWFRVMG